MTENIYSVKSDVWSFGVLTWEILCRSDPFPNLTPSQAGIKVAQGTLTLEKPALHPDIGNLMLQCFIRSPERRPSFNDICKYLNELSE